jgi:hypothetical protein
MQISKRVIMSPARILREFCVEQLRIVMKNAENHAMNAPVTC